MPISWQRRAPVMRVLAAVYAELGEEAFKGRYGRIAKLYGHEATYDAIKSFFAKDVVSMANELRTKNLNTGGVQHRGRPRQRSTVVSRTLRIQNEDTDDEVVITGENSLQTLRQSSQPGRAGTKEPGPSENETGFRSAPLHIHNTKVTVSGDHALDMPGASERRLGREIISQKSGTSKKRSYSTFRECKDTPSSFGYVTNLGKHRCLLCMKELTSAELLRKHESMSKLHDSNLKDPKIFSRGCTMLAQVYSLAPIISRPPDDTEMEPLMSGALRDRSELASEERVNDTIISNAPSNDTARTHRAQTCDAALEIIQISDEPDTEEGRSGQQGDRNAETHESSTSSLLDLDLILNATTDEHISASQTNPRDVSAGPAAQLEPDTRKDEDTPRPTFAYAAPNDVTDTCEVENVKATRVVQLLLSRGMELLAKQCVDEHPTLRMEFLKCVKDTRREVGQCSPEVS